MPQQDGNGARPIKVYRIDFYPENWLSGVRDLTIEEQGAYWLVCSLIYSRGGPIEYDDKWIANQARGCHWRKIRVLIDRLIELKKLSCIQHGNYTMLASTRAGQELKKAINRVSSARANSLQGVAKRRNYKGLAPAGGRPGAAPPAEPGGRPGGRPILLKKESLIEEVSSLSPRAREADPKINGKSPSIYERLITAAEHNVDETSLGIVDTSPIEKLIDLGCSFENHILTVVAERVPKLAEPLRTWKADWLLNEIKNSAAGKNRTNVLSVATEDEWRAMIALWANLAAPYMQPFEPDDPRSGVPAEFFTAEIERLGLDLTAIRAAR